MLENFAAIYIRKRKCSLPILYVEMKSKTVGPLPRNLQVSLCLGYTWITLQIHYNVYFLINFYLFRTYPFIQQIFIEHLCVKQCSKLVDMSMNTPEISVSPHRVNGQGLGGRKYTGNYI